MKKKHKVVYNNCYGGFGLSDEAVQWLEANAQDEALREFLRKEREELSKKDFNDSYTTVEGCMSTALYFRFGEHGIPRHHPDLIKVVQTLKKKADTPYSELKIITLNGNQYRIEEYDGWETVMEPEDYKFINL